MAVSKKIITNNQQPHDGYGYVGMAGNKGLSPAEEIFGSGVFPVSADANAKLLSRPTRNMLAASGNVIIGPPNPGLGADRQVGLLGQTVSAMTSNLDNRFSLVNAYWPNSPSGVAVTP